MSIKLATLFFLAFVILWSSTYAKDSNFEKETDIHLLLSHDKELKFKIGVINLGRNFISVGHPHSMFGINHFLVVLKSKKSELVFKRKPMATSFQTFETIRINPGSFEVFNIDLMDGTWEQCGHPKISNFEQFTAAKAAYKPQIKQFMESMKKSKSQPREHNQKLKIKEKVEAMDLYEQSMETPLIMISGQ